MFNDATFGGELRDWRQRRRMSQFDLASEAEISTRHLSFVETGRSRPSRDMVLRLSEALGLPLRSRNRMLAAAGFAPVYAEQSAGDGKADDVLVLVQQVLDCHVPFPALAVDRHWNLVAGNAAVPPLLAGASAALLEPPVNVLRLSLHPDGLAPRIVNLADWKRHVLDRLRHQAEQSGDPALDRLHAELKAMPAPASTLPAGRASSPLLAVPLVFDTPAGRLNLLSTTTVFGTPLEVTLSELAIETFFPADAETAKVLRALAEPL